MYISWPLHMNLTFCCSSHPLALRTCGRCNQLQAQRKMLLLWGDHATQRKNIEFYCICNIVVLQQRLVVQAVGAEASPAASSAAGSGPKDGPEHL
jgi:hypothetical protein